MAAITIAASGGDYTNLADYENSLSNPASGDVVTIDNNGAAFSAGSLVWDFPDASAVTITVQAISGGEPSAQSSWATDTYAAAQEGAYCGSAVITGSHTIIYRNLGVGTSSTNAFQVNAAGAAGYAYNCVSTRSPAGFVCNHASGTLYVEQCIALSHSSFYGFWCNAGTLTAVYCMAVRSGRGFYQTGGSMTVTASIALSNPTADFAGTITQSYNLSSDASASGTGSTASLTATNIIVDDTSAAQDCHWASGNDGTYDSAPVGTESNDIEGTARSDWDAGPFEITGGAPAAADFPYALYYGGLV